MKTSPYLMHHGADDYTDAVAKASAFAKDKINALVATGRQRAGAVIRSIQENAPSDAVLENTRLEFSNAPSDGALLLAGERLHKHALGQASAKLGIPSAYAADMATGADWQKTALVRLLNSHNVHTPGRYLLRSVQGEVRGFLSDRYRRMDSHRLVDAFAQQAAALGAVPVEGYALETKVALKALLPQVFEPLPGEVLTFGLKFQTSDFGDGALQIAPFMLRLVCTNFAVTEDALRQVHLGKRLGDDVAFSRRTYELDTAAMASAVGDVVKAALGPSKINATCAAIKEAAETNVEPKAFREWLRKRLSKDEAERVTEVFAMDADETHVPRGQNKWRLSNAVSWVAGQTADENRRLELQTVAGELVAA